MAHYDYIKLTLPPDKLYFTSDSHFFHDNIIKFCNRPFKDVTEMNEILIRNWNNEVPVDGHVFHLGDVSFGTPEKTKEILDRLNGKIYLLRGNHEKPALDNKCNKRFEWIKDLFKLSVDLGDKKIQKVILCHYPMLVWDESHRGSFMLYGHAHNNIKHEVNKDVHRFDVGVDAWEYKPISFKQVVEEMSKRKVITTVDERKR